MASIPPHTDESRRRCVSNIPLTTTLRGVLFRCTIRGGHATLAIIPSSRVDYEEDDSIVMVVVQMGGGQWNNKQSDAGSNADSSSSRSEQFASSIAEMRSNIRRMCKLGNELEFIGTHHTTNPSNNNSVDETSSSNTDNTKDWTAWRKFTVNYNLQSFQDNIKVTTVAKWDAATCQRVRSKFFDDSSKQKQQQQKQQPVKKKRREDTIDGNDENNTRHSSTKGKQKRIQGEILADFVMWMLSTIHDDDNDNVDQAIEKTANNNELVSAGIGLKNLPTDQNYLFIDRWKPLHPSLASDGSHTAGSHA